MHDTNGRPYALVDETKEGDILICDGGFTCLNKNDEKVVKNDPSHGLYIDCNDERGGKHFIDGQIEESDVEERRYYMGLYKKT